MAKKTQPEKLGERIRWGRRAQTWSGRVRVDGVRAEWLDLMTSDEALAQQRYNHWFRTGEKPSQAGRELFASAAKRMVDKQEAAGKDVKDRRTRLRSYCGLLDRIEIARIEPSHVASVLDAMVTAGKKKGYVLKMRSDLSVIFKGLVREGALRVNVAFSVKLEGAKVDGRPRVVLTDAEILEMRRQRGFHRELDMAALHARDLGGHRTSCLLAADWSHYDTVGWRTARVRRPKTDGQVGSGKAKAYELVEHEIPLHMVAPLRAWHEKQGSPLSGPVFPSRRPSKGGLVTRKDGTTYVRRASASGESKARRGNSFVKALRRALWKCKIYRPLPGFDPSAPNKLFCAIQTDTTESRAVDFHSFRRAFFTALDNAGTPNEDSLALGGLTQERTKRGYVGPRRVAVPAGALPGGRAAAPAPAAMTAEALLAAVAALVSGGSAGPASAPAAAPSVDPRFDPGSGADPGFGSKGPMTSPREVDNSLKLLASPRGFEPLTNALGMRIEATPEPNTAGFVAPVGALRSPDEPLLTQVLGQLTELLRALSPPPTLAPLASVTSLDAKRAKRGDKGGK